MKQRFPPKPETLKKIKEIPAAILYQRLADLLSGDYGSLAGRRRKQNS
jgi:hypothetical protein